MENKTFVLKDNSEEIRQKIISAGIDVCICASFVDSCWLDYSTVVHNGVHGLGYYSEEVGTYSQEEAIALFLSECENLVECKDVDEFISLIKDFETKRNAEA